MSVQRCCLAATAVISQTIAQTHAQLTKSSDKDSAGDIGETMEAYLKARK